MKCSQTIPIFKKIIKYTSKFEYLVTPSIYCYDVSNFIFKQLTVYKKYYKNKDWITNTKNIIKEPSAANFAADEVMDIDDDISNIYGYCLTSSMSDAKINTLHSATFSFSLPLPIIISIIEIEKNIMENECLSPVLYR